MIKRKILFELEEHLSSDQMTILVGSRQVGKTYLMNVLREGVEKKGEKTVSLNLDLSEDAPRFVSQATLVAYLELTIGKERAFVFIDEIQRVKNAGLFLKGLADMKLPYKFIISGSGSLELKAKIPESAAGRKILFQVDPISFEEFVNFKTDYQYEEKLKDFFALEEGKTTRLFSEYLVFGGYPLVVLAETASAKQKQMGEIYRSYIDRDIKDLLNLEKTDEFSNLLKTLASQIGSMITITELANTIGIDEKTVKHYLWYLEQTFIVQKVTPFYRNVRSEITKAPIYYFLDNGLRNWLLGLFGLPDIPGPLGGYLFENIIFNMLRQQFDITPTQIHFWRTKDQAEVDFVLQTGLEVIPVEAKYTKLKDSRVGKSFKNFVIKYKPKRGYIVHLGENLETKMDGTQISFIPIHNLVGSSVIQSPAFP
ncbi:ATPase [Candidatus Daviesbacteria bacterium RIFCSPHIGHO2_12_FULL_37_11]|uniref:ATPase n=1 Tax=Candidatus Daviesbacteria bacterium RIFCSPHIGHO2_12_FULL_37_11 TaxID=1797777 RepID=A0A1F5KAJ8_9BACT|nr:MAG: ATPase [Candidatus Daviesbacteria bacterium GWA1_38_6]OGE37967.1 MAG: ATPase [Candidatus Daviesbacteria bacterium RIFCSPHIGHO2_12_FULL_37_11]OGE46177.1 MAG: ATPase [Candidatus Daviesbacteria bacterium RIFCSPLOWO2_01_FULL_37_10]